MIAWHNTILKDDEGNITGTLGSGEDITKRVQAEEALKRYTRQLETVNTITKALSTSLEFETVLELILDQIEKVMPFDSGAIFLYEGDELRVEVDRGNTPSIKGVVLPGEGELFKEIQQSGESLILNNVKADPNFKNWGSSESIESWMGVPLIVRKTLLGYLTLDSCQPGAYSSEQAAMVLSFATQAAQVIDNARLYKATQQYGKGLASLLRNSQGLAATLNRDEVLQTAIEGAVNLSGVDSGAIYLLDEEMLYLEATTPPLPPEFPEELRHAPLADHPHIQKAIGENDPVFLKDTTSIELAPAEKAVCEARGLRSIFYQPFISSERIKGILILGTVGDVWILSEGKKDLYLTLSNQIGMAIENAQLYKRVIQDSNEMEKRVQQRTEELQSIVNLTAGREIRMIELKKVIKRLRTQIEEAGMTPAVDDPLFGGNE